MKCRMILLGLLLLPMAASAQKLEAQGPLQETLPEHPDSPLPSLSGVQGGGGAGGEATLAVLRANCPKGMSEADWLKLMSDPVNAELYPLRVTQGMLDTLDGRKMDLRYRYVLVPGEAAHSGPVMQ